MAKKHKDWFDRDCAIRLGEAIKANYAAFDSEGYADEVDNGVGNLELKDRVLLMATGMRNRLPEDYLETAAILKASLGPPLESETGMFTKGYWLMPVARLVEEFGRDNFDASMDLCKSRHWVCRNKRLQTAGMSKRFRHTQCRPPKIRSLDNSP